MSDERDNDGDFNSEFLDRLIEMLIESDTPEMGYDTKVLKFEQTEFLKIQNDFEQMMEELEKSIIENNLSFSNFDMEKLLKYPPLSETLDILANNNPEKKAEIINFFVNKWNSFIENKTSHRQKVQAEFDDMMNKFEEFIDNDSLIDATNVLVKSFEFSEKMENKNYITLDSLNYRIILANLLASKFDEIEKGKNQLNTENLNSNNDEEIEKIFVELIEEDENYKKLKNNTLDYYMDENYNEVEDYEDDYDEDYEDDYDEEYEDDYDDEDFVEDDEDEFVLYYNETDEKKDENESVYYYENVNDYDSFYDYCQHLLNSSDELDTSSSKININNISDEQLLKYCDEFLKEIINKNIKKDNDNTPKDNDSIKKDNDNIKKDNDNIKKDNDDTPKDVEFTKKDD